jgi:hypothetical protein
MLHKGGPVPRLVSMQGTFIFASPSAEADDGGPTLVAVAEPVYRHPADAQPQMDAWTPAVFRLKAAVEAALGGQALNHGLVQYYRNGDDYISEHGATTRTHTPKPLLRNSSPSSLGHSGQDAGRGTRVGDCQPQPGCDPDDGPSRQKGP